MADLPSLPEVGDSPRLAVAKWLYGLTDGPKVGIRWEVASEATRKSLLSRADELIALVQQAALARPAGEDDRSMTAMRETFRKIEVFANWGANIPNAAELERAKVSLDRIYPDGLALPAAPREPSNGLTFAEVSRVNLDRCSRWHPGGIGDWSVSDWGIAMGGEAGEVLNAIKKLRRVEERIASANEDQPVDRQAAVAAISTELGDTFLYLDLLAQRLGLDLGVCVRDTFNRVSLREGFPHRLPVAGPSPGEEKPHA